MTYIQNHKLVETDLPVLGHLSVKVANPLIPSLSRDQNNAVNAFI